MKTSALLQAPSGQHPPAADVGGPLEQALIGTDVGDAGARSVAIQHVVRSFDPWMVCTAH